MTSGRYTLVLLILAMLAISSFALTVVQADRGNIISVTINEAKDGVTVDLFGDMVFSINKTGGVLKASLRSASQYFEDVGRLVTNLRLLIVGIPPEKMSVNKTYMVFKLSSDGGRGTGSSVIDLVLRVEENTITAHIETETVKKSINISTISFSAKISTPVKMVPKDVLDQLPMIKYMLTPEMLNMQLAMSNITGITFKDFELDYTLTGDELKISVDGVVEVNYEEFVKSYRRVLKSVIPEKDVEGLISIIEEIRMLSEALQYKINAELIFDIDDKHFNLSAHSYVDITGSIEEYLRALGRYFYRYPPLLGAVPSTSPDIVEVAEALEELKHVLPLVVLPSNTTAQIDVYINGYNGSCSARISIANLRLGHVEFTGAKASREVASILMSIFEVLKKYVKPYGVDVKVKCNVPAETKPEVVSAIESFIKSYGAKISERMGIVIVKPSPTPTATPSPTVTKTITTITITIPVSTPKPTKVYIVEVPPISITPPTTTVTVLKTVSKILTETVEKTVVATKTVTTTYSTTLTMTKITTTTETYVPSIYIACTVITIIVAVAIVMVALVKRRS